MQHMVQQSPLILEMPENQSLIGAGHPGDLSRGDRVEVLVAKELIHRFGQLYFRRLRVWLFVIVGIIWFGVFHNQFDAGPAIYFGGVVEQLNCQLAGHYPLCESW